MNILVLDVGTSSMRGILYDSEANSLFTCQRIYSPTCAGQIIVEQDVLLWEKSLTDILSATASFLHKHSLDVHAVTLTAQRSSTLALGIDGRPLTNAIMWQDKRNSGICEKLEPYRDKIFQKTGAYLNTVFSGGKMAWLREENPECYTAAHKLLTVADYLSYKLTGCLVSDHTYGSRSLLMNLRGRQWDPELLELFGIDESKLCRLIEPGSRVGLTTGDLVESSGFPTGIPLYSAGGDQQCAALAQGIINPKTAAITVGTGAYIIAHAVQVPETLHGEVLCSASAVPGKYMLESSILTCCSLYDWFCRAFYSDPEHRDGNRELMDQEISLSPPGANGCILLPYLQGRGTPDWNYAATGLFSGLSLSTSRGDMARALLEGITMEIACNMDYIRAYTDEITCASVGGGLTKFSLFNQILADCTGLEILCYENSEATALGAWVNTAVSTGLYPDWDKALFAARSNDTYIKYLPDYDIKSVYSARRADVNKLYHKLYP